MKILISLSGESALNIQEYVKEQNFDYIIGVDGGSDRLLKAKCKIDLICGDFDSIQSEIQNTSAEIMKFDTDKDLTDFALSLGIVKEKFNNCDTEIIVIGFQSNVRLDHYYANLNLIDKNIKFCDQKTQIQMLEPGKYAFDTEDWEYFSFYAVQKIPKFFLSGLKYDYVGPLELRSNVATANVVQKENKEYKIEFSEGKLIMFMSLENE